jgi:hypothetical protein
VRLTMNEMNIRFTLAPQPVMMIENTMTDGFKATREKADADGGVEGGVEDLAIKTVGRHAPRHLFSHAICLVTPFV